MDVLKYAKKNRIKGHSAVNCPKFRDFFKGIKIKTVVEIGTFRGISTAYMAHFARKIFTFDIVDYPEKYKVWKDFKIADRIFYYTIKNRKEIRAILSKIKFDFAFIDGKHTYNNVKADFEMVKHCGRVLFHDVHKKSFKGVRRFVIEELEAKEEGTIAYWTK